MMDEYILIKRVDCRECEGRGSFSEDDPCEFCDAIGYFNYEVSLSETDRKVIAAMTERAVLTETDGI